MADDAHTLPEKNRVTPASGGQAVASGVGFTVVNFNTSRQTLRCVASLSQASPPPERILVLDNDSAEGDFEVLARGLQSPGPSEVVLYRSPKNLGFAAATNFLVNELLATPGCRHIGLLNNDAVAEPCLVQELLTALAKEPRRHGLAGGRMHKLADPSKPDTLGISIYACLMPADRVGTEDIFLGPTGGCCLLTREFAEDLISTTGYFFDERYFCYCEDTDLVIRANLLGYQPAYADRVVALHEGQASSGSCPNDFIAYHGWRNTIWMHGKLIPREILLRGLPLLALAHALSVARYLLRGKPRLAWRVYRDGLGGLPAMLEERRRLASRWRVGAEVLRARICPRFYRRGYRP